MKQKMLKFMAVSTAFLLAISLTACGGSDDNSSSPSAESGIAANSSQESSDYVSQAQSGTDSQKEESKFQNYTLFDGEEAKAFLRLDSDGSFSLKTRMYDGLPEITGSYIEDSGTYVMTPEETNAENVYLEDILEMRFNIEGDRLIYDGSTIGETLNGSEFIAVEE